MWELTFTNRLLNHFLKDTTCGIHQGAMASDYGLEVISLQALGNALIGDGADDF